MADDIILVDKNDQPIGSGEKMDVHRQGLLHRAFSILIFNKAGQMLIHQRALSKYHCPGMWTNACCSHPRPEESVEEAAHRRLQEELGFDTELKEIFSFVYKADFDNGLTEHEFDHVLLGYYEQVIDFNKDEVEDIKWIDMKELLEDIKNHPDKYTAWFKIILEKYQSKKDL